MNPIANGKKKPRAYLKHGLTTLKQAVKGLGGRVIDRRTTLGKALSRWRLNLIQDLGGEETISTQQEALIDLCVKSKLMLDSIDAWLLTQRSLVNARKRSLLPAVRERQQLADGLARYLGQLGLERRSKKVPSLTEYLNTKYRDSEENDGMSDSPPGASPNSLSRKRKSNGDSEKKQHQDA